MFLAKYSKAEAQKVADKFLEKFVKGEEYELAPNEFNYYKTQNDKGPFTYDDASKKQSESDITKHGRLQPGKMVTAEISLSEVPTIFDKTCFETKGTYVVTDFTK